MGTETLIWCPLESLPTSSIESSFFVVVVVVVIVGVVGVVGVVVVVDGVSDAAGYSSGHNKLDESPAISRDPGHLVRGTEPPAIATAVVQTE